MEEKKYLNELMNDWLAQNKDNSIWGDGLRLLIKSPMGSGKNYFTQHGLIDYIISNSPKLSKYKKILFITSRRNTVEQYKNQFIKEYRQGIFNHKIWRIGGNKDEAIEFGLEVKDWKEADIIYGHKWDLENNIELMDDIESGGYIDFIVIDEAHGLSSDDFTTASATTLDFALTARDTTNVILMSATTERIEASTNNRFELVDFTESAIKTEPRKILLVQQKTALRELEQASADNKILYFVDTATKAYQLERKFNEMGIRACAITSQPDKREAAYMGIDEQTINKITTQSISAEKCIQREERFSEDIDLIITTSKLREGINIIDKRNKLVIIDVRDSVGLIQSSGRNRNGVDRFMIVDGIDLPPFYGPGAMLVNSKF